MGGLAVLGASQIMILMHDESTIATQSVHCILASFAQYNVQSRGEVILRLAGLTALLQTTLVHIPPYAHARLLTTTTTTNAKSHKMSLLATGCDILAFVVHHQIVLGALVVLEFLLVWVWIGGRLSESIVLPCNTVWLPLVASFLILLHWFVFREGVDEDDTNPSVATLHESDAEECIGKDPFQTEEGAKLPIESNPDEWEPIGESTPLIPVYHEAMPSSGSQPSTVWTNMFSRRFQSFWKHVGLLRYPWELLVSSSVCALLMHCIPILRHLLPVSRDLILSHVSIHHGWLLSLTGSLALLCAPVVILHSLSRCRPSTANDCG
jgi:hypothetical protein